jgi:TfoX/Sxy family transcriptional regulator of competence genes
MSKYEKPLTELIELMDNLTTIYEHTRRKMFGCPSYFVNGNMFAGVFEDTIYFRLSIDQQESLRKKYDDINQFEPLVGRKMKEYIVITEEIWKDINNVKTILNESYNYTQSLPIKQKKK